MARPKKKVDIGNLDALGKLMAGQVQKVMAGHTRNLNNWLWKGARVRPGRYVKRQWKRSGKPASLKQWAKVMEPWDPVIRAWLSGDPYVDRVERQDAKRLNFAMLYGGSPKSFHESNLQQVPRK